MSNHLFAWLLGVAVVMIQYLWGVDMSYILVLTMIFSSGYAGMGAIDHMEVDSYEKCQRIGKAWVQSIKNKRRFAGNDEVFFSCIENK